MDGMLDPYAAAREESKARRMHNLQRSTALLQERGVAFIPKNGGLHLIVEGRYDFWPSTGLFIERGEVKCRARTQGRGVKFLLKLLNK